MALGSQIVPSLIQGISQQAEIARAQANAADEYNCLNEVLDGVVSRMGSRHRAFINQNYSSPFVHEIRRSAGEEYVILVESGTLRIVNRATGVQATITGSIAAYLAHSGEARKAFRAVTIGDTTFLLNRQKEVAMAATKSPNRPNWACAHFRAGGYKVTYTLKLKSGGVWYSTSYTTPDNSAAGNAQYITTDSLAEQFRQALVTTLFPAMVSAGQTGFSVDRLGSTLIIKRSTSTDFDIDTSDGVGDKQLISFKDNVRTLTDLPSRCADGYQVSVSDNAGQQSEKFYLKYSGSENTGRWEEVVKWDTKIDLDGATMPHQLVNTGPDAFTVSQVNWGDRLAGDGDNTSQDPSFVGSVIQSLQYISGRLSLTTEYTNVLSRSRNAYVYFPDTVQTKLDTAPVDYDVSNGSATDITHTVVGGGKLQFWGDLQQTYLDSGQDPIREDTTEILPLSNYEYDGEEPPLPLGQSSVLFGTAVGRWLQCMEVYFRNGKPDGEIEISAHVPRLMEGTLRRLAAGAATKKSFWLTSSKDNEFYLYQWYNQGNERVLSAWNRWTMPAPSKVLWAAIQGNTGYLLLKWPTGCTLEEIALDSLGDEPSEPFPLRLDHRISETSAVWSTNSFVLTLPYQVPPAKRATFRAVERLDIADQSQRGLDIPITWLSDSSVRVLAKNSSTKFYFGSIPTARCRRTRFYVQDSQQSPILHDKLLLKRVSVGHKDSVEYSVVVTKRGVEQPAQKWTSRLLGDNTAQNAKVPVRTGKHDATIGEVTEDVEIDLVNDSVFPATWTAMKYFYDLTRRTE